VKHKEDLLRSGSPTKRGTPISTSSRGGSASPKKRGSSAKRKVQVAEDSDNTEDERSVHSSSESESDGESEDDFETSKKSSAKKKKKTPPKKGAAANKRAKKTAIRTGRSPAPPGSARRGAKGRAVAKTAAQRAAHQALATLARNVLPPDESPGLSSLVAGLLHSYRPAKGSATSNNEGGDSVEGIVPITSEYTPNLATLAKMVVEVHNDRPNRAQLSLLNLLFRSVGGTPETDLSLGDNNGGSGKSKKDTKKKSKGGDSDSEMSEDDDEENEGEETDEEEEDEEVKLDDMDTEEWAQIVTDLVDDMRHVPAPRILLCADPKGAVHQSHEQTEREKRAKEADGNKNHGGSSMAMWEAEEGKKHVSLGAMEYRKIYKEFWYVLGHVALTHGGMATAANNEFDTSEDTEDKEGSAAPIVRLDAELIKSLILRIIELSPVGQPDVRASATLAVLSAAHAVLDRSVVLIQKLDVATRQYAAASKANKKSPGSGGRKKVGAKAEALKVRMESLKRTVEDLEEVVLGPVVQGLFVHRYRDSNEHIRAMCLQSLARFSLQRPDIFLNDKYLKYFGWMMHDKDPRVRSAAFSGLLTPFKAVQDAAKGVPRALGDENLMVEKIDLGMLEHVVAKFLPRIADAVMDPVGEVQEVAMALMLMLLRGGFLDEVTEDKLWDQTNQRCLAQDAPAAVQKDALYFILDQLEAFDDEDGENEKAVPDERKRAQQLDAIASYAAHTLTNGPVPIDRIRVEAVDLLVKSLREMPEHRGLVTDWSAMLRAIRDDNAAATAHHVTAGDRANVAKQRVLVRMLACAAREEVGSVADAEFLHRGADADAVEMTSSAGTKTVAKGKKATSMGREHENLSIALLKALPNLLIQFKGDLAIIPELASLPRFLIPTVFSLPQRKQDYMALIKNLGEIYLSSSDDRILDNTACSIVSLCNGDHARVAESKAQLRKLIVELKDRVVELMSSDDATIATSAVSVDPLSDFASVRSRRRSSSAKKKTPASSKTPASLGLSSPASDKTSLTDEGSVPDADAEYSIYLNLKRLKILMKKCDLSSFFDDRNDVNQLELLCNFVSDGLKSRLRACKPVDLRVGNADEETTVHKLIDSPEVLGAIGKSVGEGLEFLLCVIAWFTHSTQVSENLVAEDDDLIDKAMEEDDDNISVEDHVVLRLRKRLMTTLELCFAQYIPSTDDHDDDETSMAQHSEEQHSFADFVQLAAGKVTSDLRTLFPKEYADAASPILRSFALQEDGRLIGAYVRFLDSKEHLLRENDCNASAAERKLSQSLLYPMGRAVATNWTNGNRREAGAFLRHIDGSGATAADIVSTTSRQMKKIDPVRMLESQMASLRQSYENWVDDTPELENDFPSEDEMAEYEQAEKAHKERFSRLEQRASQFSQTLGVFGRLSNKKLGPALNGFVREGIRFSFSNLDSNGEDTLILGSRLSFLLLLSKYANWVKKDRKHKAEIQEYLDDLEAKMRNHEEFEDVHADDLESLATFRQLVGLKPLSVPKSGASVASARSGASVGSARSGVSVASARSGASVASALTADDRDGDESLDSVGELPSPAPSTGGRSAGSRASRSSRLSSTLPTLPEAEKEESPQDEESDSDSHFSESPGNNSGKKRSQSQMTYEHSDNEEESASSKGDTGSETSRPKKSRKL